MKWAEGLVNWLAALGFAVAGATVWADDVRVAVAAEASHAEAPISAVAARAPYILIFDAGGALLASHANPVAKEPSGAGPALARWLSEQRVTTLIAGEFGSKLEGALKERKIRAVIVSGPASLALKEVRR